MQFQLYSNEGESDEHAGFTKAPIVAKDAYPSSKYSKSKVSSDIGMRCIVRRIALSSATGRCTLKTTLHRGVTKRHMEICNRPNSSRCHTGIPPTERRLGTCTTFLSGALYLPCTELIKFPVLWSELRDQTEFRKLMSCVGNQIRVSALSFHDGKCLYLYTHTKSGTLTTPLKSKLNDLATVHGDMHNPISFCEISLCTSTPVMSTPAHKKKGTEPLE